MIGLEFSHYRVEKRLGTGGMGVVYLGVDTLLDRPVALKFMRPDREGGGELRGQLLEEARAAMRVVHENVCPVYGVEELPDGALCIAMGYCEGRSLKEVLRTGGLDRSESLRVATEITAGLAAIHRAGVIHRDVTPNNVLLVEGDTVRLLDFGLARPRGTREGAEGEPAAGTPLYMAPELLEGGAWSARADVYSLGVVLWHLLLGRHPFLADTEAETYARVLGAPPEIPKDARGLLPETLIALLERCLQKNPAYRPADAIELHEALLVVVDEIERSSSGETLVLESSPSDVRRRSGGRGFRWVAVIALTVIVVFGSVELLDREGPEPIGVAFVAPHERAETLVAEGLATVLTWDALAASRDDDATWVVPSEWNDEVGAWSAHRAPEIGRAHV